LKVCTCGTPDLSAHSRFINSYLLNISKFITNLFVAACQTCKIGVNGFSFYVSPADKREYKSSYGDSLKCGRIQYKPSYASARYHTREKIEMPVLNQAANPTGQRRFVENLFAMKRFPSCLQYITFTWKSDTAVISYQCPNTLSPQIQSCMPESPQIQSCIPESKYFISSITVLYNTHRMSVHLSKLFDVTVTPTSNALLFRSS